MSEGAREWSEEKTGEEMEPMEIRTLNSAGNCYLAPVLGWVLDFGTTEHLIGITSRLKFYF